MKPGNVYYLRLHVFFFIILLLMIILGWLFFYFFKNIFAILTILACLLVIFLSLTSLLRIQNINIVNKLKLFMLPLSCFIFSLQN